MVDARLSPLHQALLHKADTVQHEFAAVSDALQALGHKLVNTPRGETGPLREAQASQRERQLALAAEINLWRERARALLRQRDEASMQAFLADLIAAGDADVTAAVATLRAAEAFALEHPEEAQALLDKQRSGATTGNPAQRLLERARTEYDLRHDLAARQREANEFANRSGLAQNDDILAVLEAALPDPDPTVSDVAAQTLIQCHRFRAMRLSELDVAHLSVRWLAQIKHRAVIPVLIEILENPRTGYVPGEAGLVEGSNRRSRLVALAALVEWRTHAAQAAIRARLQDRDPQMSQAAERTLALFPGDWQA
jgi:hypothetical protein